LAKAQPLSGVRRFFDVTKAAGWNNRYVKQSLNVLSHTIKPDLPAFERGAGGVAKFSDISANAMTSSSTTD